MDFLSTGIQEFARRVRRRGVRRSLQAETKRLQLAEIELGREGWRELAGGTEHAPELKALLEPLRQIDLEGADTRSKLSEIENEIAGVRESEAAARAKIDGEIAQLERERAPLKAERDALSAPVADAPAAGDDSAHRKLLEQMQRLDRTELDLRERRRQAEEEASRKLESLREKLRPLQLAQDRLEQRRREPLAQLGRFLADHDQQVPPAATRQLAALRMRRTQLISLERRDVALAHESRLTDPQSVRLSVFVLTTFAVLAALALLLIFRAPPRRDWLPANTQLLVSANISRLVAVGAPQASSPWNPIWTASIQPLRDFPPLADPAQDVRRVVRALGAAGAPPIVEYNLVETNSAAASVLAPLTEKHGFGVRYDSENLGGLALLERSADVAAAQIGPETIAVGTSISVEQMIRVRLGLSRDLKLDEKFFEKFQRLDRGTAYRFVTQRPEAMLDSTSAPLFAPELLRATKLFGVAVRAAEPVAIVVLVRAESVMAAHEVAAMLRDRGAAMLRLEGAAFTETPAVEQRDAEVEFRGTLTDAPAREFLARMAGANMASPEPPVK